MTKPLTESDINVSVTHDEAAKWFEFVATCGGAVVGHYLYQSPVCSPEKQAEFVTRLKNKILEKVKECVICSKLYLGENLLPREQWDTSACKELRNTHGGLRPCGRTLINV